MICPLLCLVLFLSSLNTFQYFNCSPNKVVTPLPIHLLHLLMQTPILSKPNCKPLQTHAWASKYSQGREKNSTTVTQILTSSFNQTSMQLLYFLNLHSVTFSPQIYKSYPASKLCNLFVPSLNKGQLPLLQRKQKVKHTTKHTTAKHA